MIGYDDASPRAAEREEASLRELAKGEGASYTTRIRPWAAEGEGGFSAATRKAMESEVRALK